MADQLLDSANKIKRATDPFANISVFASAGSGKTYLLVHRILKLLLNDVSPAHILAITFTRKAAAEMLARLMSALAEWAAASDAKMKSLLQELSHPYDDASIAKARKLYETLLFSEHDIRITTFHAFCQDILKRFAIHAGVPAGFSVIENNFDLKYEAQKKLFQFAQSEEDNKLSQALFTLLRHCNSVSNIHQVLDTFIDSRSDWLSFTEHQADPVAYATQQLHTRIFNRTFDTKSFALTLIPLIQQYHDVLSLHDTKTNQIHCEHLSTFLANSSENQHDFENIIQVFFTKDIKRRKLTASKTLEKKLGKDKLHQLLSLHEKICEELEEFFDHHKKQALFELNEAWYYIGSRLIEIYQDIKFKQHRLDFDDLEWYTYLLLNQHDSAEWVQYKLDQRIQHILIDEFQDTNPTQWKLISPLLSELATDAHENHRSLFFVGDAKQSIYGFRRANSELQYKAANWAKENVNAELLETDESYRSSPAIIDFVNLVFAQDNTELDNFNSHTAVKSELWGQVEIEPLVTSEDLNSDETTKRPFRNPMLEAATNIENECHYLESQTVANKITALIENKTVIATELGPVSMRYSDIMILARNRTHLAPLERALREKNIPYNSTYDKDFLSSLEVQDVLALLTYLTQTHNDLALAQVLRSPFYNMQDEDLMQIAVQKEATWHDKLEAYAQSSSSNLAIQAFEQLQSWRGLANSMPVHDLLDKIYFQTSILKRYASSISSEIELHEEYAAEIQENLTALLQLSLDIDAGRYSNIQSFLHALQKPNASNTLASSLQKSNLDAVQVMTIHSAKGLESPVVFLIDTGPQKARVRAYQTIINWPSHSQKPEKFIILGKKSDVDRDTQKIVEQQEHKEELEEINLLYVALTRAKQYLFISGCESKSTNNTSWHATITNSLDEKYKHETWNNRFGKQPKIETSSALQEEKLSFTHAHLSEPFDLDENEFTDTDGQTQNESLASYGTLIHKIFELINTEVEQDKQLLKASVEYSLNTTIPTNEFEQALHEVERCLHSKYLKEIFKQTKNKEILREVPISYRQNNRTYHRIIDHLIVEDCHIWIIDFKTTRDVTLDTMPIEASSHLSQIKNYRDAVTKLYPQKNIRASILFTSIPALYDFDF